MTIDELENWKDNAPVLGTGNAEFEVWLDGAPVLDNPADDSSIAGVGRRRVFIF